MVARLGRRFIALAVAFLFLAAGGALAREKETRTKKAKWVKSGTGVRALIKLDKSMEKSNKQLEEETKNYNKARQAVRGGTLKKGDTASKIRRSVGEPVIILFNERTTITKWIYKPGNATFFDYKKVYLSFNEDEELIEWKVLEGKRGENE